jgi:ribonuclease P protein component
MDGGQMVSGKLMGALALIGEEGRGKREEGGAKAGIIVSKKLSNKAVVRNKLKRRLRAALQIVLPEIQSELKFVVLPNRRALTATVEELEKEIRDVLKI